MCMPPPVPICGSRMGMGRTLIPRSLTLSMNSPRSLCPVDGPEALIRGVSGEDKSLPASSTFPEAHHPDVRLFERLWQIQRRAIVRQTAQAEFHPPRQRQWSGRHAPAVEIEGADAFLVEKSEMPSVGKPQGIRAAVDDFFAPA